MGRCRLAIALLSVAGFMAQVIPGQVNSTRAISELKDEVKRVQKKEVKGAYGPEARQCFTDADYTKFQQEDKAKQIAAEIIKSPVFNEAVQDVRRMSPSDQGNVLEQISSIRQETVAECGGKWDGTCQTDAGARAQTDIATEVASALKRRLAH